MKRLFIACLAMALMLPLFGEYQIQPNQLMTPWGEKITPENAWREYPRPHLVRQNWQNLNGLWQYAVNERKADRPEEWAQGRGSLVGCRLWGRTGSDMTEVT